MAFDQRPIVPEFRRQGNLDASGNRQESLDGSPLRQRRLDAVRCKRRSRRAVENADFRMFLGRLLRAFVRRVGEGDPEDLTLAVSLSKDVDMLLRKVIARQREAGVSWSAIAAQLGCSKQAAQQRFGGTGPP